MREIVVNALVEGQNEPWSFRLDPSHPGGVVSVPTLQQGQPIDWPPAVPAQAAWLAKFAPNARPVAAAAWKLGAADWERLVQRLEQSGSTGVQR